jgi:hypothetical protein
MALRGKGYYIWQIPYCENGDPDAIATHAEAANLTHVLIKVADGPNWAYNYDYRSHVDLVPPVLRRLRERGIQVWGWHYVRGDDPVGEANLSIRRAKQLGLDGFVVDAEGEYRHAEKRPAARRYMAEMRRYLPDLPMALSSYRYPAYHYELPYSEFMEKVDYVMPQVYFEHSNNPEEQLDRSVAQYRDLRPSRPVIPTAPTYGLETWRPTAGEIRRLLNRARQIGLQAANAWSWDFARSPKYIDLWDAVADFNFGSDENGEEGGESRDIVDRLVSRLNRGEVSRILELYKENAAHVTGARTIVGWDAIGQWYEALFKELLPGGDYELTGRNDDGGTRHFTWKAKSQGGAVTNGSDTLGLRDGLIQYHYTYFTIF